MSIWIANAHNLYIAFDAAVYTKERCLELLRDPALYNAEIIKCGFGKPMDEPWPKSHFYVYLLEC